MVAAHEMLAEEAQWIGAWLAAQPAPRISPLLNLGSSTRAFREATQPWIQATICAPAAARGVAVVHSDIKAADGVDLVADILSDAGLATLKAAEPRALLCSNVLEHVPDPAGFARRYLDVLPVGGYAIVTTPFAYPYHRDPIDTMFRPTLDALAALHPGTRVVAQGTVLGGTFRAGAGRIASEALRLPALLARFRTLRASRLHFLRNRYSANCIVLEKV